MVGCIVITLKNDKLKDNSSEGAQYLGRAPSSIPKRVVSSYPLSPSEIRGKDNINKMCYSTLASNNSTLKEESNIDP